MKIKGITSDGLDKVINAYYLQHKEVIDVWRELMVAVQTDIEVNMPEGEALPPEQGEAPKPELLQEGNIKPKQKKEVNA